MKVSTFILVLVLAFLALVAAGLILPQHRQIQALKEELRQQKAYQAQLEHEIRSLSDSIDKLRSSDPAMIETVARNKFGYCRPGEVPYTVEKTKKPEGPQK